jgi:hypothetical protein
LNLFSEDAIPLIFRQTEELTDLILEYDSASQSLTGTDVNEGVPILHSIDSGIVRVSGTRTNMTSDVYVHNLIVLPGKFVTSRIDSNSQNNIFIGNKSGYRNQTGMANVFIGNEAGGINQSGTNNLFFGNRCGAESSGGHWNVCVGSESGLRVEGDDNVFIGRRSGVKTTTGGRNVFIGSECGCQNVSGTDNICVGNDIQSVGSNNIFITNGLNDEMEAANHRLQIGNLVTGRMDDRELCVHGSLFVNDVLIHYATKYIRLHLHQPPSEVDYTSVIVDTGCEKIDALQRVRQVNSDVYIDCKASLLTATVKVVVHNSNTQWTEEVAVTPVEARLDTFEVYFLKDQVNISQV